MNKSYSLHLIALSLLAFPSLIACTSSSSQAEPEIKSEMTAAEDIQQKDLSKFQKAYFASGCFWCVEAVYESVEGVAEAISGYAGGHTDNPTYRSIGTGETGHAEAVEVYYDPEIVSFETLVEVFYGSHDPTTVNGQAPDFGSQYRSIVFYQTEEERKIVAEYIKKLSESGKYDRPIVTELSPFERFYMAEDYHQNYERLHPNESYVRNVSIPRLNRFKEGHPHLLKKGH